MLAHQIFVFLGVFGPLPIGLFLPCFILTKLASWLNAVQSPSNPAIA
jgi:hypothetical protein